MKVERRYGLVVPVLCALTLLAYSNSFTTGFALDNQLLLLHDPRIREVTAERIGQILDHTYWWPNGEAGLYRPVTTLSYLFNYAVLGNGDQPAGYHWINLLLHEVNVLLVFILILRLLRNFRAALAVAALWAVHPVLTESVTNIVGRSDLIAATAVLGGFLIYLKARDATGARLIAWLAGLAAITAAGVFSKESAVVLPGVIVLYELSWRDRRSPATLLWGVIATAIPVAAMLWKRAAVLAASPPAEFPFVDNPIVGADFWIGRLTAIKVLARYLWLAVWPIRLSSDYSYNEIPLAHGSFADWLAWLTIAAVIGLVGVAYSRNRPGFFFACFAFLNLLPVANLLIPIGTLMAERLLYLPLVGLIACLVLAIEAVASQMRVAAVLFSVIVIGFALRTWIRNLDWKDDITMAATTVQTSPDSFKVHRLLAASLFNADPTHSNIDRVIAEADKSVAILNALPDDRKIPNPWNLAVAAHLVKGDLSSPADSRREYEQVVQLGLSSIRIEAALRAASTPVTPLAAEAYRRVAAGYLRLGQAEQALPVAMQAKTIDPSNVEAYTQVADAYLAQSLGEDAAIALAEGMFATGNGSLRDDLLKLYRSGVDRKGCAVIPGPRGPALNPSCDIVHRDLCAGAARAKRQDLFRQLACPS